MLHSKYQRAVYFRTESLSSLVRKIWELIADCSKNETSLKAFKRMSKSGLQTNVVVNFAKDI